MKTIPLTQGKFAKVDDEDFERLSQFKWCAALHKNKKSFYATRGRLVAEGPPGLVPMHRAVMYAPPGMDVDHKNHDTLDNQKSNLRVCTRSQNSANRSSSSLRSKSGVRGVYWSKQMSQWHAQLKLNGKKIHLGLFRSKDDAAAAYAAGAEKYFGEFKGAAK